MNVRARAIRVVGGVCLVALVAAGASVPTGCLNRPIDRVEPRTTATVYGVIPSSGVDKIDVLLVIDDSSSMGDKQDILADAVPDLVDRFVNPLCVIDGQPIPRAEQPPSPLDPCPGTAAREFAPIVDIHIGIISSSLGALGGDGCDQATGQDMAHLSRRGPSGDVATYQDQGFLAWDPTGKLDPPGESNPAALAASLKAMVRGVDQTGCGFEMPLEAAYRFLADPAPYASLERAGVDDVPDGLDSQVITERARFLRPDSLVAVILLSDENDCSVQASGPGWQTMRGAPYVRASTVCATSPNDPCCYSCADPAPSGCSADAACASPDYSPQEDPVNLRCWNQKQRYGEDFLYPTARYVSAFSRPVIDPAAPDLVPGPDGAGVDNPLVAGRPPGLVFFAGIVGVPWQAIARRDDGGAPDLSRGFETTTALLSAGAFPQLVGDPDGHVGPTDPFMIESVAKRNGTSALAGASLPGPNPVNGQDHTVTIQPDGRGAELQYACIFDIDDVPGGTDCTECASSPCDDPLCDGATQIDAKAFPGLRQLAVVRGLGEQGVAASVCPAETEDTSSSAYGYRPAVAAIVDALKGKLTNVQCLPFSLQPDETSGDVTCVVIETSADAPCDCAAAGFAPVGSNHEGAAALIADDPFHDPSQACFCEIAQLHGDARTRCQTELDVDPGVDGWCYVDATTRPSVGNAALVEDCTDQEKRVVRFVGNAEARAGTTRYVTCLGEL